MPPVLSQRYAAKDLKMAKVYRKLEDALKNPVDVTSIDLDLEQYSVASNIERISSLVQFPNLKQLVVSAEACEIPEEIGRLQNLSRLRLELSDCGDDPLPNSLGRLKNLEDLEIERSEIGKIPSTIGDLLQLRKLSLCQTSIREIPGSISACVELETLDCTECHKLAKISPEIGKLRKLRVLSLDGVASEIPIEMCNLANLEELSLAGKFTAIPEDLAELPSLKKVYLRGRFRKIEFSYFKSSPSFDREALRAQIAAFNSESEIALSAYTESVSWPIFRNPLEALMRPLKGIPVYSSFKQAPVPGEEVQINPVTPKHQNAFKALVDGTPVVFVSESDGDGSLQGHLGVGVIIESGQDDYGTYRLRCGERVKLTSVFSKKDILLADIDCYSDDSANSDDLDLVGIVKTARSKFEIYLKTLRTPKGKLSKALEAFDQGARRAIKKGNLSFFVTSKLSTTYELRQQLLLMNSELQRLKLLGLE